MTSGASAQAAHWPPIAVVIATKGDRAGAASAAASILESSSPVELCIVDQSEGSGPEFCALEADERVHIVEAPPNGLAAARNLGVRGTRAPLIAFTDDDCRAEPGWLKAIVAAFEWDQRVGVVFGTVRAAPYDRALGFIPAYEVRGPHVVMGLLSQSAVNGIGACMAIRRSTFEVSHGFDERLGTGTSLRAGEDCDIVNRCLLAGFWVREVPDAVVTHFGFRPWRDGPIVIQGYMVGLGAAYAKMLRLGGMLAILPTLSLAWRWLARGPVVDLNHRPPRLMRLRAFLGGACMGWRLPLDRATGHFG